jgi:hypothetical protein
MNDKDRKLLLVGVSVMFWSIWLSQNNIVFNMVGVPKGRASSVPSYSMPMDGNLDYGYLHRAWMVV